MRRSMLVVETDVGVGLVGAFAVAVCEDDAVGDDWRLGAIHVAGDPGGGEDRLTALVLDLEGDDGAVFDRAVLDGRFELRSAWVPRSGSGPSGSPWNLPNWRGIPRCRRRRS